MLKNSIRVDTSNGKKGYPRNVDSQGNPDVDTRFIENYIPIVKDIAASNAQNDSGVLELSFRDERYLPFEGSGVISEWQLELPGDVRHYNTISDVILHLRYTAREGGEPLREGAVENVSSDNPAGLTLNLKPEHYPFRSKDRLQKVKQLEMFARTTESVEVSDKVMDGKLDETGKATLKNSQCDLRKL